MRLKGRELADRKEFFFGRLIADNQKADRQSEHIHEYIDQCFLNGKS